MTADDVATRREARRWLTQVRPPAYLSGVPGNVLTSKKVASWLESRGLPRPTLLQLEAERARRGHGVSV